MIKKQYQIIKILDMEFLATVSVTRKGRILSSKVRPLTTISKRRLKKYGLEK